MSECHKIAIDYETNLSRTCGNVWEMPSDAATVYASSKSLNVCSILPGKDRQCRVMANHVIRDLVSEIRGGVY